MVVLRNGDAAKGSAARCKQEVAGLGWVGVSLVYLNSKSKLGCDQHFSNLPSNIF